MKERGRERGGAREIAKIEKVRLRENKIDRKTETEREKERETETDRQTEGDGERKTE
jgi:hypothetical protein